MKRFFLSLLILLCFKGWAQDYQHEVKLNILNVITLASVELGYEYYIADGQSLDAEIFINDRFSYWPKKNGKFSAFSMKIGYNYYFNGSESGLYANPFIKQRFGKYKSENNTENNLSSFIMGIGVGYIIPFGPFVVAPYADLARNFSESVNKAYWAVEPNMGIRIGYRF